ncbi:MAG TPA: transposase [Pseudonocardiaceae bacterium]|nr:transposase [Pseudonocardiaceae bacterium]
MTRATAIAGWTSVCFAHLIRDFEDAAESWPDAVWPAQAQRALRGLIHAWHAPREQGLGEIPSTVRDPLISVLEFCRDRQADITRFRHDTRVWPTNNIIERDLRPTKTQQKISGRLTPGNHRCPPRPEARNTTSATTPLPHERGQHLHRVHQPAQARGSSQRRRSNGVLAGPHQPRRQLTAIFIRPHRRRQLRREHHQRQPGIGPAQIIPRRHRDHFVHHARR